jgi:DnaJ-class molecular chaperone
MTNPYRLLGVTRDADDAAIRAAYLTAVRDNPPDRDAERFSRLRKAYDAVATQRARLAYDLFDNEAPTVDDVLHLLEEEFVPRRPDMATLMQILKGGSDGR